MRRWLEDHAARAAHALDVVGTVNVRLVGDHEMAAAHLAHCGEPGTTDVITFDAADGAAARTRVLDADLLVCVDEAHRQADARGIPVERELLLYIVHGILHCLGEDDHDPNDAHRMHDKEDEILEAIGIGPVFMTPETRVQTAASVAR